MSIAAETFPRSEHGLWSAVMDERRAYEAMRDVVPDLALPVAVRSPLTEVQQAAVDAHQAARQQLDAVRGRTRTSGLSPVPRQSV
jgi:hypothetical protein